MISKSPKTTKASARNRRKLQIATVLATGIVIGMCAAPFMGVVAPRQMFGEYIPSPNVANNGFLFVPVDESSQFFHYYKIDGASRKQYLGRIHHSERTEIVARYFAPIRR
jgi:hypothetical protein